MSALSSKSCSGRRATFQLWLSEWGTPAFAFDVTRIFAPLKNQFLLNEHGNDMVVFLVQNSDDVAHREPMLHKEIANRHLSLPDWIKRSHIRRISKNLLRKLKSVSFEILKLCHKPPHFFQRKITDSTAPGHWLASFFA
jgi:hypothetical protein